MRLEEPEVGQVWAVYYSGIAGCGDAWYFLLLEKMETRWMALRLDSGSSFGDAGTVAHLRHDQPTVRLT